MFTAAAGNPWSNQGIDVSASQHAASKGLFGGCLGGLSNDVQQYIQESRNTSLDDAGRYMRPIIWEDEKILGTGADSSNIPFDLR